MFNLESIVGKSTHFIDYKIGTLAGALMGSVVFVINYDAGIFGATTAGLKQGAYTFLLGGALTKVCERLSTEIETKYLARILGVGIPTVITIGATYFVHTLKGTPEPFDSTIPTMIFGPMGYVYWSTRKINQVEKKKDEEERKK